MAAPFKTWHKVNDLINRLLLGEDQGKGGGYPGDIITIIGGGESHWTLDAALGVLYPNDLAWRVGVGIDSPDRRFIVQGSVASRHTAAFIPTTTGGAAVGVAIGNLSDASNNPATVASITAFDYLDNGGTRFAHLLGVQPYGGQVGIGDDTSLDAELLSIWGSTSISATRHAKIFMSVPGQPSGTPSLTGGSMANGTYYYSITALDGAGGETIKGTQSAAITLNASPTPQTATFRPNAPGDAANWTPVGAAANWDCVDEASPNEDTDYVSSALSDPGMGDVYHLPNHTSESGTISSIVMHFRAKKMVPGVVQLGAHIIEGGQTQVGSYQFMTDSYADYTETWTTNPRTGAAWQWSEIDGLQIGVHIQSVGNDYARITQEYVEVNYTAPATSTGSVALSWSAVPGAASYKVYRTTSSGVYTTPAYIANPSTNSYTDTAASPSAGAPPAGTTAYVTYVGSETNSWFLGGNLGLKTATPAYPLDVNGQARIGTLTGYIKGTTGLLSAQTGVPWADLTGVPSTFTPTPHAILSTSHSDTTAAAVARGSIITGQDASPTWKALALGASGKVLRSNGTDLVYSTSTFADTYTANNLLYASGANTVAGLATGNSGILVTSGAGVPSIGTDIPSAITIGGAYVYRAGGTDISLADGGTGTSLADPNANTLLGWDDTDNAVGFWTIGANLSYDHATHTLSATGGGGAHNILSATHSDTLADSVVRGDILIGNATPKWARKAKGSAGQLITFDANDVIYTTATYPATATGTGKVLIADGTNWVASTPTYPNSATSGKVLIGDGTNIVLSTPTFPNAAPAAGKIMVGDGTNWIASTPTYPNASATAGKHLVSDGTNFVASTPTFPNTAPAAGVLLRGDGTNYLASTLTMPDTIAAGSVFAANSANVLAAITHAAAGVKYLTNTAGTITWETVAPGSGASAAEAFVTVGNSGTLSNERSLIAHADGNLVTADGGANSTFSFNTIQGIKTTSAPQFASLKLSYPTHDTGGGGTILLSAIADGGAANVSMVVTNTNASTAGAAGVQFKTGASGSYWQAFARNNAFFVGIANVIDAAKINASGDFFATRGVYASGDGGGVASTVGFTNVSSAPGGSVARSVVGTGSANCTGYLKIYIGATAYYIPYWTGV